MQLIDIGVNLANSAFDRDRDAVIARARAAGVEVMIVTGASLASSQSAAALTRQYPGVLYATAGVHPHDARHCHELTLKQLADLHQNAAVVAIGECGLDYNRDYSPRAQQDYWFDAQVDLAVKLRMPLFLHERDAHQRFCEILANHPQLPPAVIHCFTGSAAELRRYLDMGLYIGITGWICDERRGMHLRQLVKDIPLQRLLLETDAPYLTPRTMRPRPKRGRNEPAFLPHVLALVARCRQSPPESIATATSTNAAQFFGLDIMLPRLC